MLPFAYDGTAMAGVYPAALNVAAIGIVSIAGAVIAGRELLPPRRRRARRGGAGDIASGGDRRRRR